MSLDWSNLPPHILDNIFKGFNVRELKFLSLVCQNWYYVIARLLKDRVYLNCESIDKFTKSSSPECLQVIKESERPYETLVASAHCNATMVKTFFKTLNIKHAQVHGRSDNLIDLLSTLETLKTLSICFEDDLKTISKNFSIKVDDLRVQNGTPAFINSFYGLRSVQLSCRGDMAEVLKSLLKNNRYSVRELQLSGLLEDSLDYLIEFVYLQSLSLTSLRPYNFPLSLSAELISLSLQNCRLNDGMILHLQQNCPKLQDLLLNFCEEKNVSEEGVKCLWKMNSLRHLRLIGFKYSNHVWYETFCNGTNKSLQSLSFGSLDVNEDFLNLCAKFNPALEELDFDSYFGSRIDLIGIQVLLSNLKKLKYLSLKDIEICSNSRNEFKLASESLNHLHITHRGQIPVDFFKTLEAPHLKTLSLEFWKHKVTLQEVRFITKNCPKIENLKLLTFDDINSNVVHILSRNLENLRNLECNYLDVDGFLILLREFRILSYAKLDIRLETSDINILLDKVAYFRLRMREGNFSNFKFYGDKIELDVKFLCKVIE